ncbi:MAG: nitrite/sulfite reductase [bacterium]
MEEIKKEKNGFDVLPDIYRYAREGFVAIEPDDLQRLKWYGLYQQRPKDGYFMMRVIIPGGHYNSVQMRTLAAIGRDYARGFGDITTRQTFGFHWLTIQDMPDIFRRLAAVGLSTVGGGGDVMRNITGCPVAGHDTREAFDAQPDIIKVWNYLRGHRAFSNLPRKMKVSVSACGISCCFPQIHCLSWVGVPHGPSGMPQEGYNLYLGGGLAGEPHLAQPVDIFVTRDQVLEATVAIMETYRQYGNRQQRSRARLKFLMDDWGPEKFRKEIASRLSFDPYQASPHKLDANSRDHLGIFPQREAHLNYIGIAIPAGRITSERMLDLAGVADIYGSGHLVNTHQQNLVILDVPNAHVPPAVSKLKTIGLSTDELSVEADCVACIGKEFCNRAITETKGLMKKTIDYLKEELTWDSHIKIFMSGCQNACGHHHIADIGLQGTSARVGREILECYDFLVGGKLGREAAFSRKIAPKIPAEVVPAALASMVRSFQTTRKHHQTFHSWSGERSDQELAGFLAIHSSPT